MTLGLVLGWIGALTAVSTSVPQVARLIRTHDPAGVSPAAWTLCLGASIGWASHGIQLGLPNQAVPNVAVAAAALAVLTQLHHIERTPLAPRLIPALALGATMSTVDYLLGTVVFGLLIPVPNAVGAIAQGARLVRAPSVNGVPIVGLALGASNSAVWITWGLLISEPGTTIASTVGGTLALFNLVWRILRACGLRPLLVAHTNPVEPLRRSRPGQRTAPPGRRGQIGPRRHGPPVGRHRIATRHR
jgi:hypothetical protein